MPVQTRYQADIGTLTQKISDYEAQITQQLEALQSLFETEAFSDDEASDVDQKTQKKRERLNQEGRARYDELVASRGHRISLDAAQEALNRDILELTTQINTIQFQTGFAALWESICNLYNRLWGHATRLEATEASKEAAELSKPYFDKVISLTREKLPLDMRIQHTLTAQKEFMERRDELCRDIHPYRSSSTAEKGKHLFDNMRTALGNIGASTKKTRVLDANEQLNLVAAALEDFLKDSTDAKHQALLNTIHDNPLYVAAEKIASFQPLLDDANDAYDILPTISDSYKARIQQAQLDATKILGGDEEDNHGQYGRYGKGGPNSD